MIKNIIFDIGKVLVDFDPDRIMTNMKIDPDTQKELNRVMFHNPLWNEFDRSVLNSDEILERFYKLSPDNKELIRKVFSNLGNMIVPRDYVMPWLHDLKKQGYRLYILSNYAEYTYELTHEKLKFLELMDGILFSYQCKMIKPEAGIYKELLSRFDLIPSECIFIDDKEENIEGGKSLGINGIVFHSFEEVKNQLNSLLAK